MKPEYLRPRGVKRPQGFSQGVRVGDYIFVSGQLAWNKRGVVADKGNFRAQLERVYDNIDGVLSLAGASMKDIVKVTNYLTDPRFYADHREIRSRVFPKDPPASTLLFVSGLAFPEALVEVEAIAYVGRNKKVFNPPGVVRPPGYSQAVRAGDLLFVAGQVAFGKDGKIVGPGDAGAQIRTALSNVESALKLAGSSTGHVIKTNHFLTSPVYLPTLRTLRPKYFSHEPASTLVNVPALAFPELLEETEVIAAVSSRPRFLSVPNTVKPPGFSHAVRIGDLVFTSGIVARNRTGRVVGKGDVRVQIENIFTNMRRVLALAGAGLRDIIKVNMYLTSPTYVSAWREVRDRHLGKRTPPPASTTVAIASLAAPEFLAEMEVVAVVPSK
ncbi:MAG: hypothetical protein HYU29_08360 [Chloroflexi bacterium]|nr:hypothetical protein [Chloroflexota bacterium]